jgi:hypothetical protein
MISKEKDPLTGRAGVDLDSHQAQIRLGKYLHEEFEADPDIHVFNQLFVLRNEQPVQIDHLIIHPFGIVILDSHSLVGDFLVDKDGRFLLRGRINAEGEPITNEGSRQIRSPVDRTGALVDLIAEMLRQNAAHLLNQPASVVEQCPINILVAVADQSVVRFAGEKPEEIYNADFIQFAAREVIQRHRRACIEMRKAGKGRGAVFTKAQMEQISFFLIVEHQSISQPALGGEDEESEAATPPIAQAPHSAEAPKETAELQTLESPNLKRACSKCGSFNQVITHGRWCYQFRCRDCDKTASVNASCPTCGQRAHIRRTPQKEFYLQCPTCETSKLFYINPKAK